MLKKLSLLLVTILAAWSIPLSAAPGNAAGFGLPDVPKLPAAVGAGELVSVTPMTSVSTGIYSFRWLVDGKITPKATAAVFKVPAGTIGKTLQVQEVQTIGKRIKVVGVSELTQIGQQYIPTNPNVIFGGTGTSTLSVILPSDSLPSGATANYQWYHGGIEISGAQSATYNFSESERGLLISVGVTFRKPGYKDKTVYSPDLQIPSLPKKYKLLWSDEFNNGSVNPATWVPQNGDGTDYRNRGWGNNERQWYLLQNSKVDATGALNMLATRTGADQYNCYYGKCEWLSSKLVTLNKVGFKYGHIEARIKAAPGVGTWGAFWMLGSNIDDRGWPGCGEIDITELLGRDIKTTYGTLHGPLSGGGGRGDRSTLASSLADDWHTYAVDWLPDSITWYVDGVEYAKQTKSDADWVFDHEFYIILNLAMGGGFGGQVDPGVTQSTMSVDYVRAYSINGVGEVVQH